MSSPPEDDRSIGSAADFCPRTDVHYTSGVFNKAFYLLSNRAGWNVRKAFHVFLIANTIYWGRNTDFAEGSCGAVQAAKDLGFKVEDVEAVFRDVDVIPCVKMNRNFANLIDIKISPEKKFERYFDLSKIKTDNVTIEVFVPESVDEDDADDYNLVVTYNGEEVASLTSNKSDSVVITDIRPGKYHVTIEGDVPKLSIYFIIDHIIRLETNEFTFTLDPEQSHPDLGLIVRAKTPNRETRFHLYSTYGKPCHPPKCTSRGTHLNKTNVEILYCNTRPGPYYVAASVSMENRNYTIIIDVFRVYHLHPEL
jgi:hypothetical protein